MTVLVTGATGNVGSQVVHDLQVRGVPVRAFVRDPARAAQRLGGDVELAVGDLSDATSITGALDGVDRVFLSSGDGPTKVAQETAVIDVAAAAGVELIVKASTVLAQAGSPLPALDWNGQIEDHLRRSGVPAVVLRSAFYMTNLLMGAEQVAATGRLFAPAGEGRVAMIDPRDAGSVGAVALATDGHAGRTYTLTGPEPIGYADLAGALTRSTGTRIEYVDVTEEAAQQGLAAAGTPDWIVTQLVGVFRLIRAGAFEQTTDAIRVLTGREPHSFTAFADEYAALFASSARAPV